MNRFKRPLALTLALCLALLALAGCAGSQPTRVDDQPVELTLLTWPGTSREAIDEVIYQYNQKHPHVRIRVQGMQTIGGGNFSASMLDEVDVALLPRGLAVMAAQAGALRDLSALRLPQLDADIDHLFDDLSKLDGRRIGLPFELNPAMLTMNEQAFSNSGLRPPAADWTLQDLEQALQAFKDAGQSVQISALALLAPVVGAFGGQVYDPHSQQWLLDTDEAKQGLAYLARLTQAGLITIGFGPPGGGGGMMAGPGAGGGGAGGGPALIAVPGNVVMRLGGVTAQQPYPKGPKGRSVPASANLAVVSAASAHTEVALDFVRELIGSEAAQTALAQGGIRPVMASNTALAAWHDAVGDQTAQKLQMSLRGAHADLGVNYNPVIEGLTPYFEGKATLDQVLPDLLARLNS